MIFNNDFNPNQYTLPQDVSFLLEPENDTYYTIGPRQNIVIPFKIQPNTTILFQLGQTLSLQDFTLRCEFSELPYGQSIVLAYPDNLRTFHLHRVVSDYTLKDINVSNAGDNRVWRIYPFVQYFLNIQNLANMKNGYRMIVTETSN
jgi:hypothetical protein